MRLPDRFPLVVALTLFISLYCCGCGGGGGGTAVTTGGGGGGGAVTTADPPSLAGVQIFPANNPWNTDISAYPLHRRSSDYVATIGATANLHPDFGTSWSEGEIGIPYCVVSGSQAKVPVSFYYPTESDPGPYPIPPDAPIEGGASATGDRHILVLDKDNHKLYEVYDAHKNGAGWACGSGAVFDLSSNLLRPDGWTSADAAGLPILPGLVRYEEVAAGEIRHAIRFTAERTGHGFIHPATHLVSDDTDPTLPPMGLRMRLKASYDISGFNASCQVVLTALKRYGMLLADEGTSWYITGTHDSRWHDEDFWPLNDVPGSAFEAVDTGPILTG